MRRFFAITLLIILAVFLLPNVAHADGESMAVGFVTDAAGWMMQQINGALEVAHRFVTALLTELGGIMGSLIRLDLTDGGPAVYQVWKLFRDMCNALFIVLFVLIAFGTIFNTVKQNSFMYSSALKFVIIAALLINFSLAIGRTVVFAGNKASLFVLDLFPKVDIGSLIAVEFKVPAVVANINGPSVPVPPVSVIPANQLTQAQLQSIQAWFGDAAQGGSASIRGLERLKQCLSQGGKSDTCLISARNIFNNEVANMQNKIAKAEQCVIDFAPQAISFNSDPTPVTKTRAQCYREAGVSAAFTPEDISWWQRVQDTAKTGLGFFTGESFKQPARKDPTVNLSSQMGLFVNNLLSFFLLLTLVLSFLCVLIFMVVRLPAIWFLLATSALAFFALSVPNTGYFKKWFNNLLGWCIFSPLYLFVIYIGLYFIKQSGTLQASLSDPQLPFFAASFGSVLFFFIAAFIFIGGAGWALSFSRSLSSQAGSYFDKIGGALGVSEESMFGLKTVGKGIGVTTRYEGAKAGLTSLYKEKVTEPFARRGEAATARYQAMFGDKKALENLQRKHITEQYKKNDELGLSSEDLLNEINTKKIGSPEYFAAAKKLLEKGDLPADKMREYVTAAMGVSPSFGRSAQEAVERKLREQAKDKKFKGEQAVANATDALGSITDTTERKKFLSELKKSSPLVYAQLANSQLLAVDEPGLNAQQIIESNTSNLEATDMAELMDLARSEGWTLGENVEYRRDALLNDKNNVSKMMDAAKTPETRSDIRAQLEILKTKAQELENKKAMVQADANVLAGERLEAEREDRARPRP